MAQGKQANILNKKTLEQILSFHQTKARYPNRDNVIILLSFKAGLRAKEIASLTWAMVTNAEGELSDTIILPDSASKGRSGRKIPMNKELRNALLELYKEQSSKSSIEPSDAVIFSERGGRMSANSIVMWFQNLYKKESRLNGCSSHSGRRTFITNAARKISSVEGSLRDVQKLAGHSSLNMTQRYIEGNTQAQTEVVNLI
jgi:integrase